jgi:molybdate transport system substrate-binding protein
MSSMTPQAEGTGVRRREALQALGLLAWLGPAATALPAPRQDAPRIAAAADLRRVLTELAERFRKDGHGEVSLVFGASGVLARQIVQGAPFQLFLSADEAFATQVIDAGRADSSGALYAIGRLSLFAPSGSPLRVDPECEGLRRLAREGKLRRLAIANPAHAPYGRAAEAVLRHHGLWDAVQPRLVLGENSAQAAQFAANGSTDGGLLPHALVVVPPLSASGDAVLIPRQHHPPLRQRMVLLRGAGPVARRFHEMVLGPEGRSLLERHGFGLPPG